MFLDYCDEGDLRELLKKRGGHLIESQAIVFFRQIVEGFKVIYSNNIIHRDIKPANIMIKEGKAMISDFGFARCLESTGMDDASKMTFLGTPLYMSPQILVEEKVQTTLDFFFLNYSKEKSI